MAFDPRTEYTITSESISIEYLNEEPTRRYILASLKRAHATDTGQNLIHFYQK